MMRLSLLLTLPIHVMPLWRWHLVGIMGPEGLMSVLSVDYLVSIMGLVLSH